MSTHLRFVLQDSAVLEALADVDSFRELIGCEVSDDIYSDFRELLQQMDMFYRSVGAEPPWTGYLVMDRRSGKLVGVCSFKGNPDKHHAVEIAYYTHPSEEGKGYASDAARFLVDLAKEADPELTILAHTLPERNASCRILEKTGFAWVAEIEDPEDGTIWRWKYQAPDA